MFNKADKYEQYVDGLGGGGLKTNSLAHQELKLTLSRASAHN